MAPRKDDIRDLLIRHDACRASIPWTAKFDTLEDMWRACEAPEWMLWAMDTFGFRGERKLRLFAASCALRAERLWNDPQATRAIETATRAASGNAGPADLAAAFEATWAARDKITQRADYSEAMAAAASAALACVRDLAMDAAMDASRESARAAWWDVASPGSWPEEAVWQANELRRIVGADIDPFIADLRKRSRGVLAVV